MGKKVKDIHNKHKDLEKYLSNVETKRNALRNQLNTHGNPGNSNQEDPVAQDLAAELDVQLLVLATQLEAMKPSGPPIMYTGC